WGVDSGDSSESIYCAVRRSGDLGAEAELLAGLQSSGYCDRSPDWDVLHLLWCGAEYCRDRADEAGGNVPELSSQRDHARRSDVHGVWRRGLALCFSFDENEVSSDPGGARRCGREPWKLWRAVEHTRYLDCGSCEFLQCRSA